MADLAHILAKRLDEAEVLERHGGAFSVQQIREFIAEIQTAGPEFITWLSEKEAMIRSGWSKPRLMTQFAQWEEQGYARKNPERPKERQYLAVVVPVRQDASDVEDDAARAARAAVGA